jgi:hypothetical protein
MRTKLRSKVTLLFVTFGTLLAFAGVAYASSVDTAVVDVTVPTNSVSLQPGDSAPINFTMTVSGRQEGTATFEINRNWTLSGTTFTGSNPQTFTVDPREAGDPADVFTTTGTVTAANDATVGGPYTLAAGVFDITNTNTTGAKLSAGTSSNYKVTVVQPTPTDNTPPVITPNVSGTLGTNDWYTSDVTVSWSVVDNESTISNKTGCDSTTISSDTAGTTLTCSATSAGGTSSNSVTIKRDATAPTISGAAAPAANGNEWNNTNVTVSYTCGDNLSGVVSCGPDEPLTTEGADQSSTGTATDNAGNTSSATVSGINIDKTAPSVALVDGPANGGSYYFGSVPAAPTCSASDALSGLAGACSVSGYGTTVGSHTVSASATDRADNNASASNAYTVLGWTLKGFYPPVDMGIHNTMKGGQTVALKFEVFAGPTELTNTDVIQTFTQKVSCTSSGTEDPIENFSTGNTELRYDTTSGQFIFNWKSPKSPGTCYRVKMTTQDGSSILADFTLK